MELESSLVKQSAAQSVLRQKTFIMLCVPAALTTARSCSSSWDMKFWSSGARAMNLTALNICASRRLHFRFLGQREPVCRSEVSHSR